MSVGVMCLYVVSSGTCMRRGVCLSEEVCL